MKQSLDGMFQTLEPPRGWSRRRRETGTERAKRRKVAASSREPGRGMKPGSAEGGGEGRQAVGSVMSRLEREKSLPRLVALLGPQREVGRGREGVPKLEK